MRQKWKTLGICCLMLCLLLQCMVFPPVLVHAAPSASISLSSSTVSVGNNVTVTVTFSGGGTKLGSLAADVTYNTSFLELISYNEDNTSNPSPGAIRFVPSPSGSGVNSFSFQVTFKALKAGTTNLQVTSDDIVSSDNEALGSVSKSATLTVQNAASTNANLKSLTVSAGSLSPVFAAGTTSYTVNVANSVSSIKVSATAADSKAKISGTGTTNLTAGKSTAINVTVTAEDGQTTKTYKITVTRAAAATPTKKPTATKAPTPTPQKTPTVAPSATDNPTVSPGMSETPVTSVTPGTTELPTEVPMETPAVPGSTDTVAPDQTTAPSQTATPGGVVPSTATAAPQQDTTGNGMFSGRAAFVVLGIGMFFMGGTVGFLLCYVLKSKKQNKQGKK